MFMSKHHTYPLFLHWLHSIAVKSTIKQEFLSSASFALINANNGFPGMFIVAKWICRFILKYYLFIGATKLFLLFYVNTLCQVEMLEISSIIKSEKQKYCLFTGVTLNRQSKTTMYHIHPIVTLKGHIPIIILVCINYCDKYKIRRIEIRNNKKQKLTDKIMLYVVTSHKINHQQNIPHVE
ncbi:hypothetical protein AGLY_006763 [Aphis glycines]|uniref:Uncharacterized protein n=1 Tax=Aphis glycines TaxID=307491 RepID=A0A6G0TQ64_APHGL|nr:hypothetical protein AGLY_006763 [Aphis glycines]